MKRNDNSMMKWIVEYCIVMTTVICGIILGFWYLFKTGNLEILAGIFFILAGWGVLSIAKDIVG